MALKPLNHWMLQDDRLAREFDAILQLSPGYDVLRCLASEPTISFFADLLTNVDSAVGQISGAFTRSSQGIYRNAMGTSLGIAAADVSRHEFITEGQPIGLLMEPPITNKNVNYNANPDPSLYGIVIGGGGVLRRTEDAAVLFDSGLNQVCTSGYVVEVDNLTNGNTSQVWIWAPVGNTNRHSCSVFARKDSASTGRTFLELEAVRAKEFTNTATYERVTLTDDPPFDTRRLGIIVEPFSRAWFVLNQLEEVATPSSPIVTAGAATSRARDALQWPVLDINGDPILNDAEGMAAICLRPPFSSEEINNQGQTVRRALLQFLVTTTAPFLEYRKELNDSNFFSVNIGSDQAEVSIGPPLESNQDYLILIRWGGGELQIGYKSQGVVTWGAVQSYVSGFSDDGAMYLYRETVQALDLPSNLREVYLWRSDEGRTWLENFFSGKAT